MARQGYHLAKYTIAYKNDGTVEHAERTGNLAGGWVRVYAWSSREDVYKIFDGMVNRGQYKGSILGVFISHENEVTAWYDRSPRRARDTRDKSEWRFTALEEIHCTFCISATVGARQNGVCNNYIAV